MTMALYYIQKKVFDRVNASTIKRFDKLALIADMCRLNTLFEIKYGGSGHMGSSFSAMDIVVYLYYHYYNIRKVGIEHPDRDIYFSSKGHDVPGLYAVLYSLGIIPLKKFLKLRQLGGLDGHPDIHTPGIEANSGSLGMGISKGRGMVFGKRYQKRKGKVIVLTGDGEWQEGQNFEALQSTVHQGVNDLAIIMDHNKLQSDREVKRIINLRDLVKKFSSFGWHVERFDGHDFAAIEQVIKKFATIQNKPKIAIADTIKGKGVSFMEHPRALKKYKGYYMWHAGAPKDEYYQQGFAELRQSIENRFAQYSLGTLPLTAAPLQHKKASGVTEEFVAQAYGDRLCELAKSNKKFVVLDADLSADCRINGFENTYPKRFIECGIAEQDMVSMAGGLASQGLIPIVNSFASFLASRANEQIYNNLTEGNKVIYACHFAGLIPAAPGKSHQSMRDISLFGAIPNCTILQASCGAEMKMITDYAINLSKESCMLRINIGPSPRIITLPKKYRLQLGTGVALSEGRSLVLFAYGPVMLHEALTAQEILAKRNIKLKVINMPWLNRFDRQWLSTELKGCEKLFILEDHSPVGGLGDGLTDALIKYKLLGKKKIIKLAIDGFPACGAPVDVLKFHKLDGASLAKRIAHAV